MLKDVCVVCSEVGKSMGIEKQYTCKNCGATMQYLKGEGKAICEYCGNVVYVDERSDEQRSYEFERGKYRAKAEYDDLQEKKASKRQFKRKMLVKLRMLIALSIVVGIGIGVVSCGLHMYDSVKVTSVFDYIDVSFSGVNGSGKAEVSLKDGIDNVLLTELKVSAEPKRGLSNGDRVKVSTVGNVIGDDLDTMKRVKAESKYIEVSGLTEYLQDANNLSGKNIEEIQTLSNNAFDRLSSHKDYANRGRYGIYCCAGGKGNFVYDVYRVSYKGETVYSAIRFEDLLVKSDGNLSYEGYNVVLHLEWVGGYSGINGYKSINSFEQAIHNTDEVDLKYTVKKL